MRMYINLHKKIYNVFQKYTSGYVKTNIVGSIN